MLLQEPRHPGPLRQTRKPSRLVAAQPAIDLRRGETVKVVVVLCDAYKGKVSAEEIIAWSKGQMAGYKYPRIVQFTDTLPRSGTGKILWRELQAQEIAVVRQ